MIEPLIHALVRSKNEAADDVLLEALRVGAEPERRVVLDALLRRRTVRGLGGVVGLFDGLSDALQRAVLDRVHDCHAALRECGRSDQAPLRLAAMKLIALGRQGKLAYVLSENLHGPNDALSKAATEAMVALAKWVATETRRLQAGETEDGPAERPEPRAGAAGHAPRDAAESLRHRCPRYAALIDQRPEIEAAVTRAMDVHRGAHGADLLRAALLLCDWPGSKTLAILHTAKHGGQSPMVRRLQQPPAAEHVDAFLLGATHGQLRSHFGVAFAQIHEAPVLDALLRRTHWLKDHALQLCMHQVTRGVWWGDAELARDLGRRSADDAARIGEWVAASGAPDAAQDERLDALRLHAADSFAARLRLFRAAARRKRGSSVALIRTFLADPDERLVRMATRELVRRRPPDFENVLLQRMTDAPESVRRLVSRSIGRAGFDQFWQRFDGMDQPTRRRAGLAVLKLLPDGVARLARRLSVGPADQRLKAMQIAQELGLAAALKDPILAMCADPDPKLRSKAVAVAGEVAAIGTELVVDRLLHDPDARVRANTIEVLEAREDRNYISVLAQRARAANGRERGNAIKALHQLRIATVTGALEMMLRDGRSEHRISALWVLNRIGLWQLLGEVGRLARQDENLRVRRYALGVLRGVADMARDAGKVGKAG